MSALFIFVFTLFCILKRPYHFPLWVYSVLGASFTFSLGLVEFNDVVFIFNLIWDSTFALIGLIIISFCLQSLGFFECLIYFMIQFLKENVSHQNHIQINAFKLLFSLGFLCAFVTAVLGNDGAILILTPLVLSLFLRAKNIPQKEVIVFLLLICFISDMTSNPLVISNLTNIITAHFYQISFVDFHKKMILPNLFALFSLLFLFYICFKKKLSSIITFRTLARPKLSNPFFVFHFVFLIVFTLSFFVSTHFDFPLSLNCLIYALFLLGILWTKSPHKAKNAFKNAPFGIILFVLGLFIVVFGVQKLDFTHFKNILFQYLIFIYDVNQSLGIFCTAFLSSIGSSLVNNLPMVFWGNLSINEFLISTTPLDIHYKEMLIYAHLLGCNIGAKLTPMGSLCTLLWFSIIHRKGMIFTFQSYLKYSFIFTLPLLFSASLGLRLAF